MIVDCQSSWPMNCHQNGSYMRVWNSCLPLQTLLWKGVDYILLSAEPLIFLEMGGLPHSLWSMEKYLGLSKLRIILHRFFTAACI